MTVITKIFDLTFRGYNNTYDIIIQSYYRTFNNKSKANTRTPLILATPPHPPIKMFGYLTINK